jgi:hypothetical protein
VLHGGDASYNIGRGCGAGGVWRRASRRRDEYNRRVLGPDCHARTELTRELSVLDRVRAGAAVGLVALDDRKKFAIAGGLGIDLMRFERACRKGTGFFAEEPIVRTSFGPWIDVAWSKDEKLTMRGALELSIGKRDRSLIPLPLWEVFAIAGVARGEHTSASFSLGGRYFALQGEARVDVAPGSPTTFFMLFGVHVDVGAYRS